jgi:hypothetical protein
MSYDSFFLRNQTKVIRIEDGTGKEWTDKLTFFDKLR